MLSFLNRWLTRDPGRLGASLEEFGGNPACHIQHLRDDLDRFIFLLGGSDGEQFLSGDNNQSWRPNPLAEIDRGSVARRRSF
jgi:hypothetical protein